MADKQLRRLKRRELLQMLIMQCEETERLQREMEQANVRMKEMEESYERLKRKLDIKDEKLSQKDEKLRQKDEKLSQKDAQIAELNRRIEVLEQPREAETGEIEPDSHRSGGSMAIVPIDKEKGAKVLRYQSGATVRKLDVHGK